MFLSVIMPVRNEGRHIRQTLSRLLAQDYPADRFEILVVDGESTDDTCAIVQEIIDTDPPAHRPTISLLNNPKRLSSAARNIGIHAARGDAVLIVDGHCEIRTDQLLTNLAAAFQPKKPQLTTDNCQLTTDLPPACVGRPQPLDVTDATALQRAIAAARSSRLGHHPDSFIYANRPQFVPAGSVAVAYRREVFETVGFFDESFDACEDYEFNTRVDQAGLSCYFAPDVAVYYQPRDSLIGLFRQLFRYGRGRIRMARKHPDTLNPKTLLPGLFVLGVSLGWLAGLITPWLLTAYFGVLLLYFVIVLIGSIWTAVRQRDLTILPWLPPVFFTVHFAAGTGLLREAIWPGKSKEQGAESEEPRAKTT